MYYTSCTVARSPWRPYVMRRRGPNKVELCKRGATLSCYASVIAEQEKCWELLAQKFDQFQTSTTSKRVCKPAQLVTHNNVGNCCIIGNVASDYTDLKCGISAALSLNRHGLGWFIRVPIVCFFSIGCLHSPLFPSGIILG